MKLIRALSVLIFSLCFFSCSDDDGNAAPNYDSISYYITSTKTSYTQADPFLVNNESRMRGNIVDNKFFSETYFHPDGTEETFQNFGYLDGKLNTYGGPYEGSKFYYATDGRLSGIDWSDDTMNTSFRRFSHHSGNVVYADKMSERFEDASAVVLSRVIVVLDSDDNIIKAGPDANLDGDMDQVNTFSYVNGNLVSAQLFTGGQLEYTYSNVRNNFSMLNDNSFGKKVERLRYSELYALDYFSYHPMHSRNLTTTTISSGSYDVLDNGLYRKSTVNNVFSTGQSLVAMEFFFN